MAWLGDSKPQSNQIANSYWAMSGLFWECSGTHYANMKTFIKYLLGERLVPETTMHFRLLSKFIIQLKN